MVKNCLFLLQIDTLETIITSYCKETEIKLKGLKIFFDGELVKMKQTPLELDMDDGDIIDLQVA